MKEIIRFVFEMATLGWTFLQLKNNFNSMFQVPIPCSTLVLDTVTLSQTFHQLKNDFNPKFQLHLGTHSLQYFASLDGDAWSNFSQNTFF